MSKKKIRLETEKDFIIAPQYNNSIQVLLEQKARPVPDLTICRFLKLTMPELQKRHIFILNYLKRVFKVQND